MEAFLPKMPVLRVALVSDIEMLLMHIYTISSLSRAVVHVANVPFSPVCFFAPLREKGEGVGGATLKTRELFLPWCMRQAFLLCSGKHMLEC